MRSAASSPKGLALRPSHWGSGCAGWLVRILPGGQLFQGVTGGSSPGQKSGGYCGATPQNALFSRLSLNPLDRLVPTWRRLHRRKEMFSMKHRPTGGECGAIAPKEL